MATQAMAFPNFQAGTRQQVAAPVPMDQNEWNASLYAAQQRARRGPTPEVFHVKHIDNSRLATEADPQRAREIRTFAIAMTMLFLLVMVYVVQHFKSIQTGYRIEAQKQQFEELNEQNRQLRLTEAELSAPLRLDQLAKTYAMQPPVPSQIVKPNALENAPVMATATIPAVSLTSIR